MQENLPAKDETVTLENVLHYIDTENDTERLKVLAKSLVVDLKTVKDAVFQVCNQLHLIDKNGDFKKDFNVLSMVTSVLPLLKQITAAKPAENNTLATQIMPLIKKYKSL
ncbi:MAG: hypothetical protein JST29_05600 [Bacteroidetes bacterium]|nr:hypothetical protein [Bacteroidota bacterium]